MANPPINTARAIKKIRPWLPFQGVLESLENCIDCVGTFRFFVRVVAPFGLLLTQNQTIYNRHMTI